MPASSSSGARLSVRQAPPERFVLRDVHLFDPGSALDERGDLVVDGGRIVAMGAGVEAPDGAEIVTRCAGFHAFPGFVDMHVHLRTPGQEYKEDLASASRAAAVGGFTTVVGMANTAPVVDAGPTASWVLDQAEAQAAVRVGQVGAISQGLAGEQLAELRELADAGVVAFSDDGRTVADADLLVQALRYLRSTGRPLLLHQEERSLSVDGVMHEGAWSARLGMRGIPGTAESACVARDVEVLRHAAAEARALGEQAPRMHLQHVSAAETVRLLRAAVAEGLPVSAEVTPHHLLLTDELVQGFDQSLKINPPVRAETDRQELVAALVEGTIAAIATDHAPHAPHEKEVPFEDAPFGTVGLETAFAALYGGLVVPGRLSLGRLIEALTEGPCRCLGLPSPSLSVGSPADLCVVDLGERWVVEVADLRGKSRNSAFLGRPVQGRVMLTVVDGVRRYDRGGGGRVSE